jgi:hypothetical protein
VDITVSSTANALLFPVPLSRPGNPQVNLLPILGPLAILLLLFWIATSKRTARLGEGHAWPGKLAHAMPALALCLAMVLVSGCGGGGGTTPPPPPPVTGTPPGTYTLTVTAVAGSVTHTQQLTLTIQ